MRTAKTITTTNLSVLSAFQENGMADLPKALKTLLGDVVTFYFMAHGAHWNVEGADFSQYHSLFEEIYSDVYGSIDPLAENIRKMNEYAPYNLKSFIDDRNLEFMMMRPDPRAMAEALLAANDVVITSIGTAFDAASAANEQGIANFLAERDDQHKKWRWFLRSAVK